MLTVGSCFSGIDGLALGLEWTGGFETKWQIEINPYASAVLAKHWPNVKRYADIRTVDIAALERVDVICGGYPCQPFSYAGHRSGETDPRHLWPDMLRTIRELRPRYAIMENVPGHLSMGFGRVLGDLAELGYDAEWQVLSAAGAGAPHLRRRVFILANALRRGGGSQYGEQQSERASIIGSSSAGNVADAKSGGRRQGNTISSRASERTTPAGEWSGSSNGGWWEIEPNVGRVAHGISRRMDRLKCLGNAVVPQVAQKIGEMILRREGL